MRTTRLYRTAFNHFIQSESVLQLDLDSTTRTRVDVPLVLFRDSLHEISNQSTASPMYPKSVKLRINTEQNKGQPLPAYHQIP